MHDQQPNSHIVPLPGPTPKTIIHTVRLDAKALAAVFKHTIRYFNWPVLPSADIIRYAIGQYANATPEDCHFDSTQTAQMFLASCTNAISNKRTRDALFAQIERERVAVKPPPTYAEIAIAATILPKEDQTCRSK